MDFLIYFTLALFATIMILLIGGTIGNFLVRLYYTLDNARLKRKISVYGYRCYYFGYEDMNKDGHCLQIIPILKDLYIKNSSFNVYCSRLSEERLPLNVMLNWARSVAEDLFAAPIPSVKLDQWNHYWKSKLYTRMTFFHSDFPKYEDYEMGCLWGTVYLWLAICYEKDFNDSLMQRIVQLACKEKTAVPYFYHLYNATRNFKGENYFLVSMPNMVGGDVDENRQYDNQFGNSISAEEIYSGFEALTVNERCNARRVLNDVLADSPAWSTIRNEMKSRGWFKETIYPMSETKMVVNGDYVLEKNVEHEVGGVEAGGTGVSINQNEK